jgi:hypothetical protein
VLGQTDRNVAGMVLGADGKPAAGIELMLFRPGLFKKTTSDSTGHFAFDELSLGPVTIEFHPDNFNSIPPAYRGDAQSEGGGMASYGSSFSGTPYLYYNGSAEAMGGDTNVVIQLHVNTNRFAPPVSVTTSGTVFDPSGAPAPGVLVSMPPLANSSRPIQTDPAGKYKMSWGTMPGPRNMPNKVYLLGRDLEHNLAVIAEMDATTKNLDLHLQPGLTLSGAAQDSEGKPVSSAIVQLMLYPAGPGFLWNRLPATNVSAQGLFSFSALPQGGRYDVLVAAAGYGSNDISLPANQTGTNQIQLPPIVLKPANRQVAGQVIGLDGKPCWGAEMSVTGEGQPYSSAGHTDSNGHFVIKEVCGGLVSVRASLAPSVSSSRNGYVAGFLQAHGGDTNVVVKLGLSNGVPIMGPRGIGQPPANPPPPTAPRTGP